MTRPRGLRPFVAFVAAAAAFVLLFVAAAADARVANGSGAGNRGLRTISVPPSARTVPKSEAQLERAAMQAAQASAVGRISGPATSSVLSRPGILGGFAAGFLGAGLFGLFSGNGATGNLYGLAPIVGLVLQLALLVLMARLVWLWSRRRSAPALVDLSPRELADAYERPRADGSVRAPMGFAADPVVAERR